MSGSVVVTLSVQGIIVSNLFITIENGVKISTV